MTHETRRRRHGAAMVLVLAGALVAALTAASTAFASSTDHGASFAVRCDFSHRLSDDPIVHPGVPGAAHSHDFFANDSTDANSTAESLRAATTTCTRTADTAAYWLPTLSWNGQQLDSNRAVFYYRSGGKNHETIKPFPAGLKVIAADQKRIWWRCGRPDKGGGTHAPPKQCDTGELGVRILFPDCSNGHLDSTNHKSHMAYSRIRDGKVRCPRSYPRPVPALTMNVTFPIPDGPGEVTLSSGDASTMHADFFNAWDQDALAALVEDCINDVPPSKPRPPECQA